MAEHSTIEWTDHTFNPWIGCTKVSPGCDHCYAARQDAHRRWTPEGWGGPRRRTKTWGDPVKWNAQAEREGRRFRVFCASLADVFDNQVPTEWRDDLWRLIEATPHLDWLLLTKRIGNAGNMLPVPFDFARLYPHVRIGATVVNQPEADRDLPKLMEIDAAGHFVSYEPALGHLDMRRWLGPQCDRGSVPGPGGVGGVTCQRCQGSGARTPAVGCPGLSWVIAGGESGPHARPAHPQWFRDLRDQCAAAGVPFLFKQWGEWVPYEHSAQPPFLWSQHGHEIDGHALPDFESEDGQAQREWHCDWVEQILARRVGKKAAGRLLDGVEHNGFPEPCAR
jgi:protein gp37